MAEVLRVEDALTYEGPEEDLKSVRAALTDQHDVVTAPPLPPADLAAALLDRLGPMDTMRLQKLCYYVQAVHLAATQQPVTFSRFEAWRDGPVLRELFVLHRGRYTVSAVPGGDAARAGQHPTAGRAVDEVVQRYGALTGRQLSELTHREQPWLAARAGLRPRDHSDNEIPTESMRRYYVDVLSDPEWADVAYADSGSD